MNFPSRSPSSLGHGLFGPSAAGTNEEWWARVWLRLSIEVLPRPGTVRAWGPGFGDSNPRATVNAWVSRSRRVAVLDIRRSATCEEWPSNESGPTAVVLFEGVMPGGEIEFIETETEGQEPTG